MLNWGFWKYICYFNYFGDFFVWIGLFCFVVSGGYGVWIVGSLVLMMIFLVWILGVLLLEKIIEDCCFDYVEYKVVMSVFFLWFFK